MSILRSKRPIFRHRISRLHNGAKIMKCKDCGCELVEYANVAYCPLCRIKRMTKTIEMDKDTGLWEGQVV